ncbi:MAG: peptidase, partial [Chloroflexota bacterium]
MSPNANAINPQNLAAQNFGKAVNQLNNHPIFRPLIGKAHIIRHPTSTYPVNGWAIVTSLGTIYPAIHRRGEVEEWGYVLAHCLLHLGFGHFENQHRDKSEEWNAACDIYIAQFLKELKLGQPPQELQFSEELLQWRAVNEERLYLRFCNEGIPEKLLPCGVAGKDENDMQFEPLPPPPNPKKRYNPRPPIDWQACLGYGLAAAVESAVETATQLQTTQGKPRANGPAHRARAWFINHYPLLAALAASFEIVDDSLVCTRLGIGLGAVAPEAGEIYINPLGGLDEEQIRFVLAHELLHVGLGHHQRRQGRDPFLWNVACDFVINAWLVEMGVGELPNRGLLYDPELK